MTFRINDTVTVPLSHGGRATGRILYLDEAPNADGVVCADVELLDLDPGRAAPVVWAAVSELQPVNSLGHRCNYTPTRICDCAKECAVHFTDSVGC